MKKIIVFFIFILSVMKIYAAPPASSSSRIRVDGISGNTKVVISGRNPVFSWDFDFAGEDQNSAAIQIGSSVGASDIWSFNEVLLVKYKVYNGSNALQPDTTYFWQISITNGNNETSAPVQSSFHTITSAVSLSALKADLKIEWNNPFNPNKGQITKILYQLIDGNENTTVRIYTITGELVKTLADHIAERNALYTVEWDGKNAEGYVVASGIYLVNLKAGTTITETRRIAVIK
ncbi:MAG: FlgD immunoglobulin-like domain containing protein [bacterium]